MATLKGFRGRLGLQSETKSGVSCVFPADLQAFSGKNPGMGADCGHEQMPGSYKIERMVSMAKQKEPMPSKGVRMPAELWAKCDEMTQKLGLESRNEFIRDAVQFYSEWVLRSDSQRFLTPALESVIGAKVRDSENRIARALYKMAVQQNALTHVLATAYNWTEKELSDLYDTAEDDARGGNGTRDLRDFNYEEDE